MIASANLERVAPNRKLARMARLYWEKSTLDARKLQITADTVIQPNSFAVLGDKFAGLLSPTGGALYLISGDSAGRLTGYLHASKYGPSRENVTIGGLLSFLLLSGVAVTALGALLLALLAMYLLIVQVFGVTIELRPFGVR